MTNCRLCQGELSDGHSEVWNNPLFETPNFLALPSLGALVEGWLLLVPKTHFICMGALPDSVAVELQETKNFLCSVLRQTYGHVCVFEHGPGKPNLSVGCGVDHAHLHLVPLSFDLGSAVNPYLPKDARWTEGGLEKCREVFERGEDYLYLEQTQGEGVIVTANELGSQLFRRAIASQIGAPHHFNWREYPQYPNILATINKIQERLGCMCSSMGRNVAA